MAFLRANNTLTRGALVSACLQSGADACSVDVDGYVPADLAPDGSDSQALLASHAQQTGGWLADKGVQKSLASFQNFHHKYG